MLKKAGVLAITLLTPLIFQGQGQAGPVQGQEEQSAEQQQDEQQSRRNRPNLPRGLELRTNLNPPTYLSEHRALSLARQRFPGNILRISLTEDGGSQRYRIRMENKGKVFTVYVDAVTGRVTGGN